VKEGPVCFEERARARVMYAEQEYFSGTERQCRDADATRLMGRLPHAASRFDVPAWLCTPF
jgi:hypothetical protein